jgi:hypothetical protein
MSMMTSKLLQSLETKLHQVENDINEPYHSKLVILVGNLAQLLAICHCHLSDTKNHCKKYHVSNAIGWNFARYHTLKSSIRHVEDPIYIYNFFNIIYCQTPTEEKISLILKLATLMKN